MQGVEIDRFIVGRSILPTPEENSDPFEGEGDEKPDGAACHDSLLVPGRVGAFYAPCARQGKQFLQMKLIKSV